MPRKPSWRSKSRAHRAFGRAVRESRVRRALSQEELAYTTKLHRNYVGAIERGEINPTLRTMMTLASGLDIPLSELIVLFEKRCEEAR